MMKNLIRKSVAVAIVAMGALMLSCGHDQQNEKKQTEADSLIGAAYDVHDYERVLTLCDSLEQQGSISLFKAASMRGWATHREGIKTGTRRDTDERQ